jgi:hypothetical protein
MIPTSPSGRWLDRLDRMQRFFDGPIPAPDRRWVFADPDPAVRSATEAWGDLARESVRRAWRLRRIATAAPTPRERRSAVNALREEAAWRRHCRARMHAASETGAVAGTSAP